jgi:hypothetical protein
MTLRKKWERWGNLIQRVLASVGSQGSLLALALIFAPQPVKFEGWPLFFILAAGLLAIASFCLELSSDLKAHHGLRTLDRVDEDGIKAYMRQWIEASGRAAIWTRDLSWVNDDATMNVLRKKAAGGNLTICLPKMTNTAAQLREAGAEVYAYGDRGLVPPASRFTIAYLGNGGTQIAIGRTDGSSHVIEELDSSHPTFHMATDLVALAKLLSQRSEMQ